MRYADKHRSTMTYGETEDKMLDVLPGLLPQLPIFGACSIRNILVVGCSEEASPKKHGSEEVGLVSDRTVIEVFRDLVKLTFHSILTRFFQCSGILSRSGEVATIRLVNSKRKLSFKYIWNC